MSEVVRPITEEDKQKWIKALRSGKYKQGKGRLKYGNQYITRYCCLGVAREVCNLEQVEGSTELVRTSKVSFFEEYVFIKDAFQNTLINMNDEQERDFNYIADWIEENIQPTPA